MIVRTEWQPKEIGPEVLIASMAVVDGFGSWKASVTGTHEGESGNAATLWARFGSTGTFGFIPIATWRSVDDMPIGSLTIFAPDKSLTDDPKSLSGSGSIEIKQRVWDSSSGGMGVLSGGSWDDGDTESFSVPQTGEPGSGSYTTKPETRILCFRYNASSNPCKTYVMADSGEHNVLCNLCQTSYWNCPSLSGSHTCGSTSPPTDNTENEFVSPDPSVPL